MMNESLARCMVENERHLKDEVKVGVITIVEEEKRIKGERK